MDERIKPKERDAVVQALRAGVVPRLGLRHVQVGRAREVSEVVRDMDRIAGGGSAVRFVIGDYGSGKTFFLTLARTVAAEKRLAVAHTDLTPDRRIHSANGGHARALLSALMGNVSTRTKPEGGALQSVVERFVGDAKRKAEAEGQDVAEALRRRLAPLLDMTSGHDFALVVERYWQGCENEDEALKAAALRWLRADYHLKTEARGALGVRSIVGDAGFFDHLKLFGRFVRLADYDGFLVVLDEMVNLYKLTNRVARDANYEQVLGVVNDVLSGSGEHVGFYFGGTPESLMDSRRGLYSYEALRSRLAENGFAREGLVDLSGPVVRLQSLAPEELYVLLGKLRHIFAGGDPAAHLVPDEALTAFMEHCAKRIGEAYFRTPRNTIKAFLDLLAVLEQNPGTDWRALVGTLDVTADAPPAGGDIDDDALEAASVGPAKAVAADGGRGAPKGVPAAGATGSMGRLPLAAASASDGESGGNGAGAEDLANFRL